MSEGERGTLERNIERLLRHAYEPVAASEALRSRCLRSALARAAAEPETRRGRVRPRRLAMLAAVTLGGIALAVALLRGTSAERVQFFAEDGAAMPPGTRVRAEECAVLVSGSGDSLRLLMDAEVELPGAGGTDVVIVSGTVGIGAAARRDGGAPLTFGLAGTRLLPSANGCELEAALIEERNMNTKSKSWLVGLGTLGLGAVAVTVYSGDLRWMADGSTLAVVAGQSAVRVPGQPPALVAAGEQAAGSAQSASPASAPVERTPVQAGAELPPPEELRGMLRSSRRLEQVRAIELLVAAGTPAATRLLLQGLLETTDPVLQGLLAEALLKLPLDISADVEAAFAATSDARQLETLAQLLGQLATPRPALQQRAIGVFVAALSGPEARAEAASKQLVRLGLAAADPIADMLADRTTAPETAGKAAWILSQLAGEHRDVVCGKLRGAIAAGLGAVADATLPDPDKDRVRQNTGSLVWIAAQRPLAEHDRLAEVLVDGLLRATDEAQAGTLAWGLGNLKGLTDDARLRIAQQLLGSLPGLAGGALAQNCVRAVGQMAVGSGRPAEFSRLFEQAIGASSGDPKLAGALRAMQTKVSSRR